MVFLRGHLFVEKESLLGLGLSDVARIHGSSCSYLLGTGVRIAQCPTGLSDWEVELELGSSSSEHFID